MGQLQLKVGITLDSFCESLREPKYLPFSLQRISAGMGHQNHLFLINAS